MSIPKYLPPFVRSAFNYDMDAVSRETGLSCPEPTLTQQQFLEETEMRFIVERFGLTGQLPQVPNPPEYGDFCGVEDYQSALNAVKAADAAFLTFPAKLRAHFDNDPQKVIEFLADDNNRDEAIRLGLILAPNSPNAPTPQPTP